VKTFNWNEIYSKVVALIKSFPMTCHTPSALKEIGAILTPGLSFGHNLCFRYRNGSCKPILDIHVSIAFQWYKKLFNPLDFDPWNHSLNIWESIGTPTPKVEVPLGVWRFIPSHFSSLLGFLSWPTTLQALALVTSLRLGLRKVITIGST